MSKIKKILLCFVCLSYIQTTLAALPIQVEVKVLGKDVIFIFYRDKDQIVDLQHSGNIAIANVNIPSKFKLLNPIKFNQYASNIRSTSNNQKIVFEVNEELKYQGIINGEKLDAIKYRSEQPKEEDFSKLGTANNDPGAILYKEEKDTHTLSFYLGNDNSRIAAFFREKYLWVTFDQKKFFSFNERGIFSKFELVPSSSGTVLRMKVDSGFNNAKIEKIKTGWNIKVSKDEDKTWVKENIIYPEPISDSDGFVIKGNFAQNKIVSFIDPELGDVVNVVPVTTVGSRVISRLDSIEFSLLNSIQGIAVVLYSDEAIVEKYNDAIKLISNTKLSEDLLVKNNSFSAGINKYLKLPTILPYLDKNLDILDFNQQKSRLISEASTASDNASSFSRNFDLAKFFFVHGWYQESIDALEIAKKYSNDDYRANLQARFLMAVNRTLVGEHFAAKEEYNELLSYDDIKQIAEINIWNNYNEFALGTGSKSIGVTEGLSKILSLYSDDKYWPLIFGEIELALIANDMKIVERLFRETRKPQDGKYANSIKFYKAEYYRKKKQYNLAKQYYGDLIGQDSDMFNKVRSEFALTKLRQEEKEITVNDAIEVLEKIRYGWRGDQLEYDILLKLATYYKDSKDIMNALRTYKYIQTAFDNKVSNFYITSEMARIYNHVFLPGGIGEKMDDFTAVALFYEFKELNPIGDQGDNVIIAIAKRLVRLDLLENAAELLRHQIYYRLQGVKRVLNADTLAVVLLMDKKPSEAIQILDYTDKDNFNFSVHEYRVRLRARALIDLKKYDEAINYLKDDKSNDARAIKKEALFKSENWSSYADLVGPNFDELIKKVNIEKPAAQDILRLAISYYMLNMQVQLIMISKGVADKNPSLKIVVDLLISSSGSIDYRNLDKSLDIDQMEILLDKYKSQFLDSKGK